METSNEYTVICPHCDYDYTCGGDFGEGDHVVICESCNEIFECEGESSITYSTKKIPCAYGKHDFTEIEDEECDIDQEACDRYYVELERMKLTHLGRRMPHIIKIYRCTNCDKEDYEKIYPTTSK